MPDSQSVEPGFESPLVPFRSLGIFVFSTMLQFTSDSDRIVTEQSLRAIAAWLEYFTREVELVLE